MKHPANEEWMGFLYGETAGDEQTRLTTHLRECALCRDQVEQWRQTTTALDSWPDPASLSRPSWPAWWKIAAALIGCALIGFTAGRKSIDTAQMQASLEQRLDARLAAASATLLEDLAKKQRLALRTTAAELAASQRLQTEQVVARLTDELEEKRSEDHVVLQTALQQFVSQYETDYLSLRQSLETVAVMTEAGFQRAKQQLVSLANYQADQAPTEP